MKSSYTPLQREALGQARTSKDTDGDSESGGTLTPLGEALNRGSRTAAQRRHQEALSSSPRVARQLKLAQIMTGRSHAVLSAYAKQGHAGVVQRVPISTGQFLEFFDPDIPAFLTLRGFRTGESPGAKYRVHPSGVEFYFEYETGLYFDLDGMPIDPATLAPHVEVQVHSPDDDPPPGGDAIRAGNEAIKQFNLVLMCKCPPINVEELPPASFSGRLVRDMLIHVELPDLAQLLREWEQRGGTFSSAIYEAFMTLVHLVLATPPENAPLLEVLSDVVVGLSGVLIARMPRIEEAELQNLAYEDTLENAQASSFAKYQQALNELGGEVEGSGIDVETRRQIIKEAYQIGFNISRLLKSYRTKYKGNEGAVIDQAVREMETAVAKGMLALREILTKAGLTAEQIPYLIEALPRFGLGSEDLKAFLNAAKDKLRKRKPPPASLPPEEIVDILLAEHRERSLAKLTLTSLDPKKFTASGKEYSSGVIDVMLLDSVARSKRKGHTLPVNKYIERHFTRKTLKFLADHPSMYIEIYEGQVSHALANLVLAGYTQVLPLSSNEATDFRMFTARNPTTGEAAFVIVGLSGIAYQREIAAHFLYYNPPINPLRIVHHRLQLEDAPRVEFEQTLEVLGVIPDIVQMGNVEQVERILGDAGIKPAKVLSAPNLFGKLYFLGGRVMISLRVEPQLYADRAGAFLRAVQHLNPGQVTVIFTGTAGGLAQGLEIGDLVAPEQFLQADTLNPSRVTGVENLASAFFQQQYGGELGLTSGAGVVHGAVDTILMEDSIWFEQYAQVLTIVEQETAHLARAAALCAERTHLYVFFKISDLLGKQDFTANEVDRPQYRTSLLQGDVVLAILRSVAPGAFSGSSEKTSSEEVPTEITRWKDTRDHAVLDLGTHVFKISLAVFKLLQTIDPESSLLQLLEAFVSPSATKDLKKFVERFSNLFLAFNLSIQNFTVEYPPTTFTITLKQKANTVTIRVIRQDQKISDYETKGKDTRFNAEIGSIAPGEEVEIVLLDDEGSELGRTTAVGGQKNAIDLTKQ